MTLSAELERSAYAVVGAADEALSAARNWWNDPGAVRRKLLDNYRDFADHGQDVLRSAQRNARQDARKAHRAALKVPGAAPAEGELSGIVSKSEDLPLSGYDDRTAADISAALTSLTQR